jgi:transcriptional/translational regulatory protein YebC/TACO1
MVTAQVSMMPKSTVTLDKKFAEQALKLTSDLEDHDDVQTVAANYDIPDEIIEKAS